jgi:hypothetical protein
VEGLTREQAQAIRERANELRAEERLALSRHRKPLYADVASLITTGFLSHQVRILDTQVALRSLSPSDMFMLRHRAGLSASNTDWKTWLVASSIWMVDGINLLEDPYAVSRIHRMVGRLPLTTLDILMSIVNGLLKRVGIAVSRTEAYGYEPYSRVQWRLFGRGIPMHTGIPGGENLGLNAVQQIWIAHNQTEDDREVYRQEWQAAKLIASSNNPKGVKKLNKEDKRILEAEEGRRERAIQDMVRLALFGPWEEDGSDRIMVAVQGQKVEVPRVRTAVSPDELADQYEMWVKGEKDWHDVVVDTYKQRIRDSFEKEKVQRERALEEAQQYRQPGVSGGSSLVGYTLEQLQEARPELFGKRAGTTKRIHDDTRSGQLYEKYVASEIQPAHLQQEGPEPEAEDRPSLQEQVAGRRPAFRTQPIGSPSVRGPRGSEGDG